MDTQKPNLLVDLLTATLDMQNLNKKQVVAQFNELSAYEKRILTEQIGSLAKTLNVHSGITVGMRVAKGIIAGTRLKDHKVCSALVDDKDFHKWQAVEDIEL